MRSLFLCFAYDTTGDFGSGSSGWLCFKIIRMTVDHNRPSDNLFRPKSVCQYRSKGLSPAAEQRRQISRMVGMWPVARIIMISRIREPGSAAVSILMDMQCKKVCIRLGQPANIRYNQYTAALRDKFNLAMHSWIITIPSYAGCCHWISILHC